MNVEQWNDQLNARHEKEIILACFDNLDLFKQVSASLDPEDFRTEAISMVWRVCKRLATEYGSLPSMSSIAKEIQAEESPELTAVALSLLDDLEHYDLRSPEIIVAQATRLAHERRMEKIMIEYIHPLMQQGSFVEAARQAKAKLGPMEKEAKLAAEPIEWFNNGLDRIAEKAANERTDKRCFSTGIPLLDQALGGGYRPGHLTAFQGATGVGKTSLSISLAATNMENEIGTLYIETEMSADEIMTRMHVRHLGFDQTRFTQVDWTESERKEIQRRLDRLNHLKGFFHCVSFNDENATLENIERAVAWARTHIPNFSCVVIDVVQDLVVPKEYKRERLKGEGANIVRLKNLCVRAGVAGIAIVHTNRDGMKWADNSTVSGTIEVAKKCDNIISLNPWQGEFGPHRSDLQVVDENRSGGVEDERNGGQRIVLSPGKTRHGPGRSYIFVQADRANHRWTQEEQQGLESMAS